MATKKIKRPDNIMSTYAQREGTYRDFATCIRDLIVQVIASNGYTVHSVTCRAKTQSSLSGKLERAEKSYAELDEITDLAGVRVITHFTDDAEAIASLIEAELDIDSDNSIDKRRLLEPNEFGYLSIHHVAQLPERRASLTEYSRFKGLKVEIQTRSILQHAWAEIEHDLGYKTTIAVPRKLRRRISRLAGLLELADQEFQTVRDEIGRYERELPQLVIHKPEAVEIDKSSLAAYLKLCDIPRIIDSNIANAVGSVLTDDVSVDYALARLSWLGVKNLAQVSEHLCTLSEPILKFAAEFLKPTDPPDHENKNMARGMCLFYLAYVLVGSKTPQMIEKFVREAVNDDPYSDGEAFAKAISQTYAMSIEDVQTITAKPALNSPSAPMAPRKRRVKHEASR
jgi:putative GTP pyrophosphokinase